MTTSFLPRRAGAAALGALVALASVLVPSYVHPAEAAATDVSVAGAYTGIETYRDYDSREVPSFGRVGVPGGQTVIVQTNTVDGPLPLTAGSIQVAITATNAAGFGYLLVGPTGGAHPSAPAVNFQPGRTFTNHVVTRIDASGRFTIYNASSRPVSIIADLEGWFAAGTPSAAGMTGLITPARVVDTRIGLGAPKHALSAGQVVTVSAIGHGIPAGVTAVIINLTGTAATGSGYFTVWKGGTGPTVSQLSYASGWTAGNQVFAPVSAAGTFSLSATGSSVQAVVDIWGYVVGGTPYLAGAYLPMAPHRVLDTRTAVDPALFQSVSSTYYRLNLSGRAGFPTKNVGDPVLNLTVIGKGTTGWMFGGTDGGFAHGTDVSYISNAPANGTLVAPYSNLEIITSNAQFSLIIDAEGYFLVGAPTAALYASTATETLTSIGLSWTPPYQDTLTGFTVRRSIGSSPPATPTAGQAAGEVLATSFSFTDTGLTPGTEYAYSIFAHDADGHFAPPATIVTSTLTDTGAVIHAFAGNGQTGTCGEGESPTLACIPTAYMSTDSAGTVLLGEAANGVYRIASGVYTRIAGLSAGANTINPTCLPTADGGDATSTCVFGALTGRLPDGRVVVSDRRTLTLRVINADGSISTLLSRGTCVDNTPVPAGCVNQVRGLSVAPDGTVFFSNDIALRKVSPDGTVHTLMGPPTDTSTSCYPPAVLSSASCINIGGVAADLAGGVYARDGLTIDHVLSDGTVSRLTDSYPDPSGPLLDCGDGGPVAQACLGFISDIAVSPISHHLFFTVNGRVREVDGAGKVFSVAGTGDISGTTCGDEGPAAAACLHADSLAFLPNGDLLVADFRAHLIRRISGLN